MVELTETFLLVSFAKVIALALGTFIVSLAYRGYRRNASKPLLYVSIGFSLITAGTVIEGLLFNVFQYDLLPAIGAGTLVTILGFVAIIYSIYSSR